MERLDDTRLENLIARFAQDSSLGGRDTVTFLRELQARRAAEAAADTGRAQEPQPAGALEWRDGGHRGKSFVLELPIGDAWLQQDSQGYWRLDVHVALKAGVLTDAKAEADPIIRSVIRALNGNSARQAGGEGDGYE